MHPRGKRGIGGLLAGFKHQFRPSTMLFLKRFRTFCTAVNFCQLAIMRGLALTSEAVLLKAPA
jgi:hypothetical protein